MGYQYSKVHPTVKHFANIWLFRDAKRVVLPFKVFNATRFSMRPVCQLMIFLLFTLLYLIIKLKINLLVLLKEPSREKALLTLHVLTEMHFFYFRKT